MSPKSTAMIIHRQQNNIIDLSKGKKMIAFILIFNYKQLLKIKQTWLYFFFYFLLNKNLDFFPNFVHVLFSIFSYLLIKYYLNVKLLSSSHFIMNDFVYHN